MLITTFTIACMIFKGVCANGGQILKGDIVAIDFFGAVAQDPEQGTGEWTFAGTQIP
tara:strand:+ start:887 stop:1057 length:171 start_codon:yes stop_codon:yes gene_type:complete